jgi:predicted signal transduction protein with EAL and GGDEF domain
MHLSKDERLLTRLHHHPALRERVETLLNIVENVGGECTKADAAEQAVIEEIRKLGHAALQAWAEQAVPQAATRMRTQQPELQGSGKKKSGGTRSLG